MKLLLMLKRNIGFILAAMVFGLVVAWLLDDAGPVAQEGQGELPTLPVTVVTVQPRPAAIGLEAIGISHARWPVAVTATVSGHVEFVHPDLVPGQLFEKGAVLIRIEDSRFRSDLEQAKAAVAEARLRLAEMENEHYVAEELGQATSAFGRREPHVRAAKAQLKASMALVETAEQRLAETEIAAPFDSILLAEQVSPGQYINAGDELFQLASSASLDVEVELSADQWLRLGQLDPKAWAEVSIPLGKSWDAELRYLNPVMDATTRQRSLVLEVAQPYRGSLPLLPDQQVERVFRGLRIVRRGACAGLGADRGWPGVDGVRR